MICVSCQTNATTVTVFVIGLFEICAPMGNKTTAGAFFLHQKKMEVKETVMAGGEMETSKGWIPWFDKAKICVCGFDVTDCSAKTQRKKCDKLGRRSLCGCLFSSLSIFLSCGYCFFFGIVWGPVVIVALLTYFVCAGIFGIAPPSVQHATTASAALPSSGASKRSRQPR